MSAVRKEKNVSFVCLMYVTACGYKTKGIIGQRVKIVRFYNSWLIILPDGRISSTENILLAMTSKKRSSP